MQKCSILLHFFIVNCTDLLEAFDFWKNLVSSLRNCKTSAQVTYL